MFLRTNKMWRQPLNKNDHNWKFEKEETLHFCKWTVLRLRLLLQCPLKLSSESMVGRLKWLTSFTSFTKLSDQRTHVKSLVTVLLAHFPLYKTQTRFEMVAKLWIIPSWAEHIVLLCSGEVHKNVKNCIIFVFDMPDIAFSLCFAAFPNIREEFSFQNASIYCIGRVALPQVVKNWRLWYVFSPNGFHHNVPTRSQ